MKKFVLLFLILPTLFFSQQITLSDMIDLLNYNKSDATKFIIANNFFPSGSKIVNNDYLKEGYTAVSDNGNVYKLDMSSRNNSIIGVTLTLFDLQEYLKIKNQITSSDFVLLTNDGTLENGNYKFKNNDYRLMVQTKSGNYYILTVIRNKR